MESLTEYEVRVKKPEVLLTGVLTFYLSSTISKTYAIQVMIRVHGSLGIYSQTEYGRKTAAATTTNPPSSKLSPTRPFHLSRSVVSLIRDPNEKRLQSDKRGTFLLQQFTKAG